MLRLDANHSKRILVVGDAMLDVYYEGEVSRISPEAPVPVFKKTSESAVPGGAANVAINLVAAGQSACFSACIGADAYGNELTRLLNSAGVDTSMLRSGDRKTTVKTRFIANDCQQVMRLDVEETVPLSQNEADALLDDISRKIDDICLIIISDYNKGLMTEYLSQRLIQMARASNVHVLVDVKDRDYRKYSGAFLLKPNKKELSELTGKPVRDSVEILEAAAFLREETDSEYVLTTCGGQGMLLKGAQLEYAVDAVECEVYDVTGAGDTAIAYLAASLANGLDIKRSVDIANCAAGIQVSKIGTSPVFLNEVEGIISEGEQCVKKLVSLEEYHELNASQSKKTIVFTNGCFDIIHAGHVRYLKEAAKLGDLLIVGLNSDSSVRLLKGEGRPINCEADRAEVLCSLECVDYVIIFDDKTPLCLIEAIKPDLLVKGGDYAPDEVVGKEIVESYGGKVGIIPLVEGKSTTGTIRRIKDGSSIEGGLT